MLVIRSRECGRFERFKPMPYVGTTTRVVNMYIHLDMIFSKRYFVQGYWKIFRALKY